MTPATLLLWLVMLLVPAGQDVAPWRVQLAQQLLQVAHQVDGDPPPLHDHPRPPGPRPWGRP